VLGYVIVGNNMESELYVRLKKKACDQMGIEYEGYHLREDATQKEVMECVKGMQESKKISGILVQLPLPEHIQEQEVLDLIGPEKDVDGLHPLNIGRK
jgi:5,10-methylene-tetrahydrofolate dehydrogenase/methenyl tetrahydrofolate cyclohydrolase